LLVGFPGETDAQFEELLEFVRRRRFERLGAFAFCPEPDTPAAELDGQLPEAVKLQRRDRLMAVQQEIAFDWNAGQVGRQWQAIVDAPAPRQNGVYLARGTADAPEIDGQIYLTGQKLSPGQIVACEIVAANGYDLAGVQV